MLKRMIPPVLIAVICAFCCMSAVAEESESEILFRNIPWDSSVSEVQALLKAELGEEITLKKGEPFYYMDRPELGCYSGYNSDELDYYCHVLYPSDHLRGRHCERTGRTRGLL